MRNSINILLGLSLSVVMSLSTQSQRAEAAKQNTHFLEVPVLYATTRAKNSHKGLAFDGHRNLTQVDHGLSFGTAFVTVETSHEITPELKLLGCKNSSKKQLKLSELKAIAHSTDFQTTIANAQSKTSESEIAVFVHGYNNTLIGAATSAARLELALGRPVVLFSWPSQAKLKSYVVDECNAEWSVRPFQLFMTQVERTVGAKSLTTVSHSMGNRLINWYLQSRNDRNGDKPEHFKEIVLTSPDIDRATFKNYFWKVDNNADKVRLYISAKDKALKGSGIVHGNERAGSAQVAKDLRWQIPSRMKDVEVVDFTQADEGWLGHSIQYDIISSMHKTGTPGPGLKAVQNPAFKGDYVRIEKSPTN